MNEWFKKLVSTVKEKWAKWSILQKGIIIGVVIAVIVAVVLGFRFSSTPTTVKLFNSPITSQADQDRILSRLDKENVKAEVDSQGFIRVADERIARRMKDLIIQEGLVPVGVDPWNGYFERGWSTTDADQNERRKLAIKNTLKLHIEALDDIASAEVDLVQPDIKTFRSQQNPVSASIILRFVANSDMATNAKKIRGVEQLVLSAVEGLKKENLTIMNSDGTLLNDDVGMQEFNRLSAVEKSLKIKRDEESKIRALIYRQLEGIAKQNRLSEVNVKVEMDMSEETVESTRYSPFVKKPDNPDTPYDDSEIQDAVVESSQTVTREWQGTGFNPQGPTGVEGQNPPVYSDMSNVIGRQTETGVTQNFLVNTDHISRVSHPYVASISVSVNIDGVWKKIYDKNRNVQIDDHGSIMREYTPLSAEEIATYERLIKGGLSNVKAKNYSVVVTNLAANHQAEFDAEDEAYWKARQTRITIILVLVGLAIVLFAFILYRFISRELERRRRIKAEEERRRQELARIAALQEAQNEGMEVTMSVEERRRAELQENAIAMAKEHPEDVAMLIRTWLMEE